MGETPNHPGGAVSPAPPASSQGGAVPPNGFRIFLHVLVNTASGLADCRDTTSPPSPRTHRPIYLRKVLFPPDVIVLAVRPIRGLKQDRNARVIIAGHALVQNVRRGHYELAVEAPAHRRVAVAFGELAVAI
jgi:hypothetical protein